MKVASYNILSGGFNSYNYEAPAPERLELIINGTQLINADFVGLVDTFRWDSLYSNDQLARMFGYKNAYCINLEDERLKQNGHNNGITVLTNLPVENFETISLGNRNAIRTGLQLNNKKIDLFTVYLDDLNEDIRVAQITAWLKQIKKVLPTIIMGDLNTLGFDEARKVTPILDEVFTKYPNLTDSMKPSLDEMKRGKVIKILEENGFMNADKVGYPTVPSKLFPVQIENPIMRLDYAFHTKNIQISNFQVPKDSIFELISDHFPIVFELNIK